jgi:3-phosphoshikimate 1-carboxyvinyltransferase
VGLNPSRCAVLDVLRRAGAVIDTSIRQDRAGEPIGSIRVRTSEPRAFEVTPRDVPLMIDEIPALAALAAMRGGVTMTVRGASELRVKESDRITMLAFAIAGTAARAPVSIQGADSVAVSYPGFFAELERLAQSR